MWVNIVMLALKSGPQIATKTGNPAGLLFRRIWYSVGKSGVLGITEYRQGRPLVRIQDDILQSLDNRKSTILVLLDLRAAFDTVDHQILLDRLDMFGIRGNAHKWMQSYLSQRSQVVNIRDTRSRCVQLPCGMPQGSVLGPLLFSIWVTLQD